jgi:outer membrane protein OmpA-like peptidoglycan-associated protein
MSSNIQIHTLKAILSIAAAGFLFSAAPDHAQAQQQPSAQTILQALTPKPLTRGLTASPSDVAKTANEQKFIDTVRNRQTRSLSTGEREQIATIVQDKPNIDLDINFDYNSAAVGAAAQPGVKALGEALSDAGIKNSTFVIAGHTDGKGGDDYNQALSEKRADAIKRFLVDKYKIPAANLVTVGYGKNQLKNKNDPFASENRRVQIANVVK